jgi:hypothetical protein
MPDNFIEFNATACLIKVLQLFLMVCNLDKSLALGESKAGKKSNQRHV